MTEADADGFEQFVRVRGPALLRAACLLTGDRQLAEDLLQNALARCFRSWSRLHDASNAEAYTRRVMYHLQISWWRRRRVPESLAAIVPERPIHGDHASAAAIAITLRAAMSQLTQKQRAVLVLRFFEDRSEAETADMLGVTVGTVKSQTSKALRRLRELNPDLARQDDDSQGLQGVTR